MKYTISDKRILEDLKKSTLTFGMQLEMARKYNQGDTSFAKLVADKDISRSRAEQIVKILRIFTQCTSKGIPAFHLAFNA